MESPSPRHRPPLHCDTTGDGPPVVLLHGVAFGPETFRDVAEEVAGASMVLVPHRPGYGRSAAISPPDDLATQADWIVAAVARHCDGPAVLAGVSGGATLALAIAVAHPRFVRRLVLHEPALGPLGPGVAAMLTGAAAALAAADDPTLPAVGLARGLAGEAVWDAHPALRRAVARHTSVIAREVSQFAAFAPTIPRLAALRRLPVVSCVGRESGPERYEVSRALIEIAGATEIALPCGHLAQVAAPRAFAAAVAGEVTRP